MCRSYELAEVAGFADDWRQLGSGGHQHPNVILAERTRFYRLDYEDTLKKSPVDQRHSEE